MRILMLTQFYPPVIGGEERHVKVLSEALASRGHHVVVVTIRTSDGPGAELEIENGVRVYRISGTLRRAGAIFKEDQRRHAPPFPDPELTWNIHRIVKAERPDIVHAHNWLEHSFVPLKALHDAKLVVTLHDYGLVCAKKNMMRSEMPCAGPSSGCLPCASQHYGVVKGLVTATTAWASNAALRRAVDRFITVSGAVAERCGVASGSKAFDVIPVFLSDSVQSLEPGCEQWTRLLPREPYLLFVGDLARIKGIHILLDAYAGLAGAPPLVLIGRRCSDTPPDLPAGVKLLASWPHKAVLHAWSRCLAGIVPSTCLETCGTVAMEASAFGKPVIASRTGGLPETVRDNETGLLVPPNDVPSLRSAMQRIVTDEPLRRALSQAALIHSQNVLASAVVSRIEASYHATLRSTEAPAASSLGRQGIAT